MSEVRELRQDNGQTALPGHETADREAKTQLAAQRRRRLVRRLLLGAVPLAVVAAALYAYLHGGRYVSTDNAYVKSHVVNVAAEVPGTIEQIFVEENQRVDSGAELFRLRDAPYRIALASADAALAQARSQVEADRQAYRRSLAEIELYRESAAYARTQFQRQQSLVQSKLGTIQDLDSAKYALDTALRQIVVAEQQAATLLARLQGDPDIPVTEHPAYQAAVAARDQAELDLQRTLIRAPFAGVVTRRPEVGDYAERGMPISAVVADQDMWVEANFKETQLTNVRPGQDVEIEVDTYPGRVWHGSVLSISEATGAEFALLPPQNATGNWIKIVQRIPVRIAIDAAPEQPPLRVGMSTRVTVDTRHARSWRDLLHLW
ncbi:MAG: HlyD family secretion protein [Pseudomonadales bacterium]